MNVFTPPNTPSRRNTAHRAPISILVLVLLPWMQTFAEETPQDSSEQNNSISKLNSAAVKFRPLQEHWVACQFGGDGEVSITDQLIKIGYGDPLSGVRWEGEFPKNNYEIELEARRVEGFDFFCGLTFPVGENSVSLILGGWGGGIVGISSIDGDDASSNETTKFQSFENEQWYHVRTQVTDTKIECWIDNVKVVDVIRRGHTFDIRGEMEQCVPLGVGVFQCDAELRNLKYRVLSDESNSGTHRNE